MSGRKRLGYPFPSPSKRLRKADLGKDGRIIIYYIDCTFTQCSFLEADCGDEEGNTSPFVRRKEAVFEKDTSVDHEIFSDVSSVQNDSPEHENTQNPPDTENPTESDQTPPPNPPQDTTTSESNNFTLTYDSDKNNTSSHTFGYGGSVDSTNLVSIEENDAASERNQ
uniref:LO1 n=1 Tax=Havana anole adomavirus TaxID=2609869 RepID=A0A6F9F1Y8_9VIRU|nr:TPA_asm: LO1 [Havana anole adomavirus]